MVNMLFYLEVNSKSLQTCDLAEVGEVVGMVLLQTCKLSELVVWSCFIIDAEENPSYNPDVEC